MSTLQNSKDHDSMSVDTHITAFSGNNAGSRGVGRLCGNERWYFMRASYGRGRMAYDEVTANGVEAFLPAQVVKSFNHGRMEVKVVYPLPGNIFIHCTETEIESYCSSIAYLDFAYDHTRTIDGNRNPRIIIPDVVMKRFIEASSIQHPGAHYVDSSQVRFLCDDHVRVTGGPFAGVVGRVAKVFGKKRVVVSIPGIVAYATAYIDSRHLEHIDDADYEMTVHEKYDERIITK